MKRPYKIIALSLVLCGAATCSADDNSWIEVEGGAWAPSVEVLTTLKSGIRPYVEAQARNQQRELQKWSKYTFQYQGQQQNGRKLIFVSGFCSNTPFIKDEQLSKRMVLVLDGGTCFFDLKYDPEKKQFYGLYINGKA